jgi:hypothetical protein
MRPAVAAPSQENLMPDVTTKKCRDGWSDHATKATDLMHEALTELGKAQLHLEKDFSGRLQPLIDKQKTLCGRTLRVCLEVHEARKSALERAAVLAGE